MAVAYYACGNAHFRHGQPAEAVEAYGQAYDTLRGNVRIDYKQLGLNFKLYACEVLHNRAIALAFLGQVDLAAGDLRAALDVIQEARHQSVIGSTLKRIETSGAQGTDIYELPDTLLFRPSIKRVNNAKKDFHMSDARVVATAVASDTAVGFEGVRAKATRDANLAKKELDFQRAREIEASYTSRMAITNLDRARFLGQARAERFAREKAEKEAHEGSASPAAAAAAATTTTTATKPSPKPAAPSPAPATIRPVVAKPVARPPPARANSVTMSTPLPITPAAPPLAVPQPPSPTLDDPYEAIQADAYDGNAGFDDWDAEFAEGFDSDTEVTSVPPDIDWNEEFSLDSPSAGSVSSAVAAAVVAVPPTALPTSALASVPTPDVAPVPPIASPVSVALSDPLPMKPASVTVASPSVVSPVNHPVSVTPKPSPLVFGKRPGPPPAIVKPVITGKPRSPPPVKRSSALTLKRESSSAAVDLPTSSVSTTPPVDLATKTTPPSATPDTRPAPPVVSKKPAPPPLSKKPTFSSKPPSRAGSLASIKPSSASAVLPVTAPSLTEPSEAPAPTPISTSNHVASPNDDASGPPPPPPPAPAMNSAGVTVVPAPTLAQALSASQAALKATPVAATTPKEEEVVEEQEQAANGKTPRMSVGQLRQKIASSLSFGVPPSSPSANGPAEQQQEALARATPVLAPAPAAVVREAEPEFAAPTPPVPETLPAHEYVHDEHEHEQTHEPEHMHEHEHAVVHEEAPHQDDEQVPAADEASVVTEIVAEHPVVSSAGDWDEFDEAIDPDALAKTADWDEFDEEIDPNALAATAELVYDEHGQAYYADEYVADEATHADEYYTEEAAHADGTEEMEYNVNVAELTQTIQESLTGAGGGAVEPAPSGQWSEEAGYEESTWDAAAPQVSTWQDVVPSATPTPTAAATPVSTWNTDAPIAVSSWDTNATPAPVSTWDSNATAASAAPARPTSSQPPRPMPARARPDSSTMLSARPSSISMWDSNAAAAVPAPEAVSTWDSNAAATAPVPTSVSTWDTEASAADPTPAAVSTWDTNATAAEPAFVQPAASTWNNNAVAPAPAAAAAPPVNANPSASIAPGIRDVPKKPLKILLAGRRGEEIKKKLGPLAEQPRVPAPPRPAPPSGNNPTAAASAPAPGGAATGMNDLKARIRQGEAAMPMAPPKADASLPADANEIRARLQAAASGQIFASVPAPAQPVAAVSVSSTTAAAPPSRPSGAGIPKVKVKCKYHDTRLVVVPVTISFGELLATICTKFAVSALNLSFVVRLD